jgi:hypothetical protein
MRVQAFASELAVERFDEAVVGRLAWPREVQHDTLLVSPYIEIAGNELRSPGRRGSAALRSHFYQRATDSGFSVLRVVSEVFALNVGQVVSARIDVMLTIVGVLDVARTMYRFSKPRTA